MRDLILSTLRRWVTEAFTPSADGGGFFWYSSAPEDAAFCINPSAMLAGTIQRFLHDFSAELTREDRASLQDAADRAVRSIVLAVRSRGGLPYWTYLAVPNRFGQVEPNDALHHGYIIWGTEDYRRSGGSDLLTWTPSQALASLDPFVGGGRIAEYPQDVPYESPFYRERPARLWGVGMLMAVKARLGDRAGAATVYQALDRDYGPGPEFRLWPSSYSADSAFYPRMAAHLLIGIVERDFAGPVR